jgi:hypothetical protein
VGQMEQCKCQFYRHLSRNKSLIGDVKDSDLVSDAMVFTLFARASLARLLRFDLPTVQQYRAVAAVRSCLFASTPPSPRGGGVAFNCLSGGSSSYLHSA